nr:DUF6629 family protein [Aurantiacibacter rhizosphaerae]
MRHAKHPREVLLASMPLLFALHQFIEGFVWLGLGGTIGDLALQNSSLLFILYAQAILPFLMPLSVLLIEQPGWRRTVISVIVAIAFGLMIYMTYGVMGFQTQVAAEHHSIAYRNAETESLVTGGLYIFVTCGALILSGHKVVRWFGILNLIGLSVVALVKQYAFSSVWCLYAAIISVMLYWQFSQGNIRWMRHRDKDAEKNSASIGATASPSA